MTRISNLLEQIKSSRDSGELLAKYAYGGFDTDKIASFGRLGYHYYQGKVRELLALDAKLQIFHTDRLSAFDRYIGLIPFKGIILAKISEFWLRETATIMPTHLVAALQERVLITERLEPIKIEVIVRGYMTGSMQRAYLKGERDFCGQHLPEGLTPSCRLNTPIITPTTKAAVFEHDENIAPDELIARGVCTKAQWQEIAHKAVALFTLGQQIYRRIGWILVDTKYEFGLAPDGTIKVIDEVHTPDSSRLWVAGSYEARVARGEAPEMLDKEIIRRYLMDQGFSGEGTVPVVPAERLVALAEVYLKVAETLVGHPLEYTGDLEQYMAQLHGK